MEVGSVPARRCRGPVVLRVLGWPLRLGPAGADGRPPATPFRRLAVVHLLSTAGDALVTVALAGSVFVSVSLTAARGRTAIGLLCTLLPFLIVGPFLGAIIDRTPGGRRAMLSGASFGRALGCLLMAAWIHGLLFFPAAFVTLVCSKAYLVSRAALLPNMVDCPQDLVPANAKLAIGSACSTSLAGLAGVALYRLGGSATVLHVDAAVFVVCAVKAARLHPTRVPMVDVVVPSPVSGDGAIGDVTMSLPASDVGGPTHEPPLPPGGLNLVAVSMASMRAMAGLMTALVVFALRRDGAPLYWYGLVGAASVVGNLGGAALAPVIRLRLREERIVPGCAVLIGVAAIAVTQMRGMHRWPAALVMAAVVTLLAAVAKLAFDALVQRDAPVARRGRVFARLEALFQLVWVLAALVPILIVVPLLAGFIAVAVCTLTAAVATVGGLHLAGEHRLPRWWPGLPTTLLDDGRRSGDDDGPACPPPSLSPSPLSPPLVEATVRPPES